MGTYERRIQAPEKSLNADWVPEEGELFKNGANLYMGDNTTASNALTPINGGGVKRYVALLTQTGTDAPVATVLENSLGGTVVWTYDGAGSYSGTLSGAFPENKTWISIPRSCLGADSNISSVVGIRLSDNVISLTSGNPSTQEPGNDVMNSWPIEIRVYP